jgi:hypothetical protein
MDTFSTYPEHEREMLISAYNVITNMGKWWFLKSFKPGDGGFMFTDNPQVRNISNEVNKAYGGGHSGASLAMTMRVMQKIAINNNLCDVNPK